MQQNKWWLIIICSFFLFGCSLTTDRSAMEIYSTPTAKVYIDGKELGMTPYKNNSLKSGEISIRLVSEKGKWERKIRMRKNLTTVINWTFVENEMGGYILSMEKTGAQKSGIIINSIPDKSTVLLDDIVKGLTPTKIDDVGIGEKQLTISFPGYKSMNIFLRATNGYDLILENDLLKETIEETVDPIISPTQISNSPLGNLNVLIKQTETGWLRVRKTDENNSVEIAKINSGEKVQLIEKKSDKWKIKLSDGQEGWIAAKYAEMI